MSKTTSLLLLLPCRLTLPDMYEFMNERERERERESKALAARTEEMGNCRMGVCLLFSFENEKSVIQRLQIHTI